MSAVYRRAIAESIELAKAGEDDWALEMLDEALTLATTSGEVHWIQVIGRHAAVISEHSGDLPRTRSFYERVLARVPDDALSLFGLAEVLWKQGEFERAEQEARRCLEACAGAQGDLRVGLIELVQARWPGLGTTPSQ